MPDINTYLVAVKNSIVNVSNANSMAHEQIDFSVFVLFHCFTDLLGCPHTLCQCVPYTVTVLIVTNSIVSNSMPHKNTDFDNVFVLFQSWQTVLTQ